MSLGGRERGIMEVIVTLKTHRLRTTGQIRAFLDGADELDVQFVQRAAARDFIIGTLSRLGQPLRN